MSSPTRERRSPGTKSRATSTPPSAAAQSTDHADIDRALIGDESLWVELFNGGRFRLAVACDVCGRWLVAGKSKRDGRGPVCAARAVVK